MGNTFSKPKEKPSPYNSTSLPRLANIKNAQSNTSLHNTPTTNGQSLAQQLKTLTITDLNVAAQKLSTLPPLGKYTQLKTVNISHNAFTQFPVEICLHSILKINACKRSHSITRSIT